MKPEEHRPARLIGRVLRCLRGDISKRSNHPRWTIRIDLRIDQWQWCDSDTDLAVAPHGEVQLVASEARWLRWLGRQPAAGEQLQCTLSYSGEPTMEIKGAVALSQSAP